MKTHNVQQGTEEWLMLRVGKITSSKVKKILSSKSKDTAINEMLDELFDGYDLDTDPYVSPEMEWGTLYEPIAREEYERLTGVSVEQIGFCTHDTREWIGLSPDGFIGKGREGAIEIKCPTRKTHISYVRNGGIPEKYWDQVLHYFLVNDDQQWVDFISYHPNFSPKPLYIHRVNRADVELELSSTLAKLDRFWTDLQTEYKNIMF